MFRGYNRGKGVIAKKNHCVKHPNEKNSICTPSTIIPPTLRKMDAAYDYLKYWKQ